jgi:hypothetical protein
MFNYILVSITSYLVPIVKRALAMKFDMDRILPSGLSSEEKQLLVQVSSKLIAVCS